MRKKVQLWALGLVALSLGVVLLGLWGVAAAVYGSHWSSWSATEVLTCFEYVGEVFFLPTLICLLTGFVLLFRSFVEGLGEEQPSAQIDKPGDGDGT